jgi:hypothetical protein
MKLHGGVLIFAEQEEGEIHQVAYELLGKGRELADNLGVPLSSFTTVLTKFTYMTIFLYENSM